MQESLKASPDPAVPQKSPESFQENSPETGDTKKVQSKNQAKKESSNKKKKDKQKPNREAPTIVPESRVFEEENIKQAPVPVVENADEKAEGADARDGDETVTEHSSQEEDPTDI